MDYRRGFETPWDANRTKRDDECQERALMLDEQTFCLYCGAKLSGNLCRSCLIDQGINPQGSEQ